MSQNSLELLNRSKSRPHCVHKILNNNQNQFLDISTEIREDSSDALNSDYNNFIHDYNTNEAKDMSQKRASSSYLTTSISQPLGDCPTLSSTLSWEFNTKFFKDRLIFDDKKSDKFKIFLDIRMDDIRLNFPGGNLFNVEVSTDIGQPVGLYIYIHVCF
jgi:hypothetical protein